ncbi:MAG: DUF4440 domain-containing protein [Proteobacteria bacterium]|nr:DUF4440 domain-containing protein [Pseudomonadota bacterium]
MVAPPTVLVELQNREPIFHRPELGTTRADFEAMTAEDFWEVGASGRVYSREQVLAVLEQRYADPTWRDGPFQTSDFHCRCLAPDVFLFTYSLNQMERLSHRATVWRRSAGRWIALYHQGTLVSD